MARKRAPLSTALPEPSAPSTRTVVRGPSGYEKATYLGHRWMCITQRTTMDRVVVSLHETEHLAKTELNTVLDWWQQIYPGCTPHRARVEEGQVVG